MLMLESLYGIPQDFLDEIKEVVEDKGNTAIIKREEMCRRTLEDRLLPELRYGSGVDAWSALYTSLQYFDPSLYRKIKGNRKEWNDQRRKEELVWLLSRVVREEGSPGSIAQAERYFSKRFLLVLLSVIKPSEYIAITNANWLQRITSAFSLPAGSDVYSQNRAVSELYHRVCRKVREISPELFRSEIDDYLGLTDQDAKPFQEFLQSEYGYSQEMAFRYSRRVREILQKDVQAFSTVGKTGFGVAAKQEALDQLYERIRNNRYRYRSSMSVDPEKAFRLYNEFKLWVKDKASKSSPIHFLLNQVSDVRSLIDNLKQSALERKYLRHYTTLSGLIYMIEGEALRLTRGDDPNMNDQLEWKRLGQEDVWHRTFISSFSGVANESAAMWGLYGKPSNEAIRISFDAETIKEWLRILEQRIGHYDVEWKGGRKESILGSDIDIDFGNILYGGSVNPDGQTSEKYYTSGSEFSRKDICKRVRDDNFERLPEVTGWIKSDDWRYEEESRLIVRVHPNCVDSQKDLQYVYVPLPREILGKAEFMFGPNVPEKLHDVFLDKLMNLFNGRQEGILHCKSQYTGNLKFK